MSHLLNQGITNFLVLFQRILIQYSFPSFSKSASLQHINRIFNVVAYNIKVCSTQHDESQTIANSTNVLLGSHVTSSQYRKNHMIVADLQLTFSMDRCHQKKQDKQNILGKAQRQEKNAKGLKLISLFLYPKVTSYLKSRALEQCNRHTYFEWYMRAIQQRDTCNTRGRDR